MTQSKKRKREREIAKLWIPPLPVPGDGAYAGWFSGLKSCSRQLKVAY
ncbi:hypothetical protein COLO4_16842 [Corchorus olitorius]|uniref:Uncharacterized protein n=1 Tax=Corchorus olitorius TaxID=93759 RepID=A0A1R3JFH2_9ROSI|nr:hypothetical protein COLO4_16842 [Corchorus olitorius]